MSRISTPASPTTAAFMSAFPQEFAHRRGEIVEPVVMHPVPRALEAHDFGGLEVGDATILERVGRPALLAIDEERRAGDAGPELLHLGLRHVVGRPGADVIVEL